MDKPPGMNRKALLNAAKAMLLVLAILITLFLFGSLYENYCGELLNQELKRMLTIARANATYMQSYFQELQDGCRAFIDDGDLPDLLCADTAPLESKLSGFWARRGEDYLYAAILDAQGRLLWDKGSVDGLSLVPPASLMDEEAACHRGFWLDENTYALAFWQRIYQDRALAGVFVGILDFSAISNRLFRYVRIGDGGSLSVCDENGVVLVHPDGAMLGRAIYGEEADGEIDEQIRYVQQSFEQKERGKAIFNAALPQGRRQILLAFCRTHVFSSHYIVTASLPYSEAVLSIQNTKNQVLVTFGLLMALIFLLLLILVRQMRERTLIQAEQRHLSELNAILIDLQNRQSQLHQKENLQAIGVFTSGIAHEFSNLLVPIQAYCELLMLKHHEDAALYESLFEIYQAAAASGALAKQLLSFSRSSKPQDALRGPIDAGALLSGCIRSVSVRSSHRIQISLRLPEKPLFLLGNQSMLHQAVNNLLINACQSMKDTGTLMVSCEKVPCQAIPLVCANRECPFIGDGVMITISDTGCGMTPETLEQIFQPFFSTRKDGSGTGLGLMIVQNIINQHDGLIDVTSTPGKGTTFRIVLPEYLNADAGTAPDRETIFIVHMKDSSNLHLYRRLLGDGYPVYMTTQPLEAVRRFTAMPSSCRLLITEYRLESFSGISLSRTFRRILPAFPVMLMTGLIHPSEMMFDPVSAPNAVLLTSISYEEFRAKVDELKTPLGGKPNEKP
ncbi:MAG: ATP-binding protein, partial [Clostridia bacterium]|nr:ATP-binding protein [Clostridia bacterium]